MLFTPVHWKFFGSKQKWFFNQWRCETPLLEPLFS